MSASNDIGRVSQQAGAIRFPGTMMKSRIRAAAPRPVSAPAGVLERLEAYWNRCRRGQTAPSRDAIDPGAIVDLLPVVFMVDIDTAAHLYRVRLIGTALIGFLGRDCTGETFDVSGASLYHRHIFAQVPEVAERMIPLRRKYIGGDKRENYEVATLPLSSDGCVADKVIGAVAYGERAVGTRLADGLFLMNTVRKAASRQFSA